MRGWARRQVADLAPGYGAWVMATGIVSTALALFGRRTLATILLAVALGASGILLVANSWRLVAYRSRFLADARDPAKAFGYFTLVAAANVIGVRFAVGHHPLPILILGAISVPLWLVLTYAIPGFMMVGPRQGSVVSGVNGSWFLWVVATQLLAAAAATLALSTPALTASMAPLAVALWGISVVLYLLLLGMVTLHLLDVEVTPHALSPTYWIYMGATAITVLAGAGILALGGGQHRSGADPSGGLRSDLCAVGLRDLVGAVAHRLRGVAPPGPARAAALRAGLVEHGVPARHVRGRLRQLRPRDKPELHGRHRPRRAVDRGRGVGRCAGGDGAFVAWRRSASCGAQWVSRAPTPKRAAWRCTRVPAAAALRVGPAALGVGEEQPLGELDQPAKCCTPLVRRLPGGRSAASSAPMTAARTGKTTSRPTVPS